LFKLDFLISLIRADTGGETAEVPSGIFQGFFGPDTILQSQAKDSEVIDRKEGKCLQTACKTW
jgi:hypothetical protein